MIRINLLKQPVRKKVKKSNLFPVLIKIFIGSAVLLIATGAGWYLWRQLHQITPRQKEVTVVRDDFTPSPQQGSAVVEEVVRDKDDAGDMLRQRGMLELTYDQLGPLEKINYEIHFAKNVCDLLYRTSPPDVEFKRIEVKQFVLLKGEGGSSSKEKVADLFKSLKREKVDILPKPESQISASKDGFSFTITCKVGFGLNLTSPFLLAEGDLPIAEDIDVLLKRIIDIAVENKLRIKSGPTQVAASVDGKYRRVRYQMTGTSTYADFVACIENLYKRQLPCAFESFTLKAVSKNSVAIDAAIIFTTRIN